MTCPLCHRPVEVVDGRVGLHLAEIRAKRSMVAADRLVQVRLADGRITVGLLCRGTGRRAVVERTIG